MKCVWRGGGASKRAKGGRMAVGMCNVSWKDHEV